MLPESIAGLFLENVHFVPATEQVSGAGPIVRFEVTSDAGRGPEHLRGDNLPLLALPDSAMKSHADAGQVVIGVEGADRQMGEAVAELLSPAAARIALVHVTWLPGIVSSPLDVGGIDNPHPQDLLAYQGAREALVGTAEEIRSAGFEVTTHLREDRDPAGPIGDLCRALSATMLVLGLGSHGAGIGRRLSQHVPIATLYVRAR